MSRLSESQWADVEALRARIMERGNGHRSETLAGAAQAFAMDFASAFSSVVLARLFLVVPFDALPPADRAIATRAANGDPRLRATTRVLSLLGTFGREPAWRNREHSVGHLAIPLLDRAHVEGIPMITRLLADLEVDLAGLDDGRSIASQRMLGGLNGKFSIPDAQTTTDPKGRWVVPSRDFVNKHAVRTVFGMGGAYVDGTLAVAVFFTDEIVTPLVADRFPSLISNFKMATAEHLKAGRIYAGAPTSAAAARGSAS